MKTLTIQMNPIKFIALSSLSLLFLAACSPTSTPTRSTETTMPTPSASAPTEPIAAEQTPAEVAANSHSTPQNGGQVVETGNYHLEFVALPEETGIHIDFYVQTGDSHEAVPDAKVTAQIELPNGDQQTLDLPYDQEGKHYAVFFPSQEPGEYKVAVLSDIQGEKVNSRFTFKR